MAREAIFISYRREDSAKDAAKLYETLAARIGASYVFKDVDDIPLGADFGRHISEVLPRCRIALIVIGPGWAKVRDQDGRRRLEDPFDWVRIEVELAVAAATRGDLQVIPILVNGARMPRADEVPTAIHGLLARNAAIIRRQNDFVTDVKRLLSAVALVVAPEMVRIPAGEFMMGSPNPDPIKHYLMGDYATRMHKYESPQHLVRVQAFEMGKHPVTFAEWDAAIAAGANLHRPWDQRWGRDQRPVIEVSWEDAHTYIEWLDSKTSAGYRLPSEAEWEYCCRAGTQSAYSTGEEISHTQARFEHNSTAPVGSYPPNAFNLHDMHGNVIQWCEDVWHENYKGAPTDGSPWTTGGDVSARVLRGGCWNNTAGHLRSALRRRLEPRQRSITIGFRVARALEAQDG